MPLVLNSSGGGSVTLTAPSTASNVTLTAPASNATLITTASNGQVIPKAALPVGSILQIVSTTKTDVFSSTSSTPVAVTGLSATITPTSTTSKILVRIVFNAGGDTPTANCDYYVYKNGSLLSTAIGDAAGSEQRSAAHIDPSASRMHYNNTIEYLDSPATTSATTYQLYQRSQPNYNFYINRSSYNDGNTGRTISTITLTEIAA